MYLFRKSNRFGAKGGNFPDIIERFSELAGLIVGTGKRDSIDIADISIERERESRVIPFEGFSVDGPDHFILVVTRLDAIEYKCPERLRTKNGGKLRNGSGNSLERGFAHIFRFRPVKVDILPEIF